MPESFQKQNTINIPNIYKKRRKNVFNDSAISSQLISNTEDKHDVKIIDLQPWVLQTFL